MANGEFGLERELKIIKSGIRSVFTPHIPVDEIQHFFGREEEATRLVSVINSPGQHILVYGDRGVGKTSLAKTTCKVLLHRIQRGLFFEKSCDSNDCFSTVFEEPLEKSGIDFSFKERTQTHNESGGAGINLGMAKADVTSKREVKTTTSAIFKPNSPSWVANQLKDMSGVFLIDEADSIQSNEDKKKISELIKLLSDCNSDFKLVVVGIAKTGEELTAGHPSVERCLKEVSLQRMCNDDLKKIILNGMKSLSLIPDDYVVNKIVDISAGYPHFTHLISLKCGEYAISNNERHITRNTLKVALSEAVKDSEGALKRMFDTTLRALNKPAEYKLLLLTAAYCKSPEFRSAELREKLNSKFGVNIDSQSLSRRLTLLTKGDKLTILEKPARGCFQFTDPRMPSFLKMALNSDDNEI
ncbi:AAA family ATPase [Halomonas qinghailakensis]|uniref:AAA family ATPase n=1 Tax=Halomonas qinghailakensis TaxID=2937790 RepID=A0AA46TNQ1_9GAMM|nr:AAA family ATPase [Halomonas sp. ZZQ-149]UYO73699.1 AAA family ATPase [Halomonas sp. ZZQ-149]